MAEPKREPLGAGAARAAPTAPHATAVPDGGARHRRSGPERFWSRTPARIALVLCLAFSAAVHYAAAPFELPHGFEVNDVEGEAAIPVDLLAPDETPPAEAPNEVPPPQQARADDDKGKDLTSTVPKADAGVTRDAGSLRDAGAGDGSSDGAARRDRRGGRRRRDRIGRRSGPRGRRIELGPSRSGGDRRRGGRGPGGRHPRDARRQRRGHSPAPRRGAHGVPVSRHPAVGRVHERHRPRSGARRRLGHHQRAVAHQHGARRHADPLLGARQGDRRRRPAP